VYVIMRWKGNLRWLTLYVDIAGCVRLRNAQFACMAVCCLFVV
jgi:hypothetical protein